MRNESARHSSILTGGRPFIQPLVRPNCCPGLAESWSRRGEAKMNGTDIRKVSDREANRHEKTWANKTKLKSLFYIYRHMITLTIKSYKKCNI